MSPRAAARLESLGFTEVYDYEAGKSDWLATPLPTEGRGAGKLDAAAVVRGDDIACHLGERLGDVANRVRAAGKNVCIVVDDRHIVLGRISPNPPKDTDGRREESGRGVRELQGK